MNNQLKLNDESSGHLSAEQMIERSAWPPATKCRRRSDDVEPAGERRHRGVPAALQVSRASVPGHVPRPPARELP